MSTPKAPFPTPVPTWHRKSYSSISPLSRHLNTRTKNVLITGGGSGIGAAIAHSFAASGASTISILGRREEVLVRTGTEIEQEYPDTKVFSYVCDMIDWDAVTQTFDAVRKNVGQIDILIANAGYLPPPTSLADSNPDFIWTAFQVNVQGNINLIQAFLPLASPTASVVHISAGAAHVPYLAGFGGYSASKLAAAKLFEYLGRETEGLFLVNLHPGLVKTGMQGNPKGLEYDDVELAADFAVWAVSPEARFLNGKLVWVNWDVDELKAMAEEIEGTNKFTLGLLGWP